MRSVTVRLDDLRTTILCLGYVGENEHTRINIDAKKMYDQYPSASASLTVCPPEGESYPAVITRDGDMVIWDITDSDLVAEGSGEIQLSFTQGETVAKTFIGRFKVSRSLVPTGDIPSGLDDFLTRAGAALTAIPETIDEALAEAKASGEFDGADGQDGQDGADGADGFSPIATVTKSGNKATISITDANGTTTAEVTDGADGAPGQDGAPGIDGFSPRATVSKSGSTATITITDAAGTTTAQISDGESADIIDDTSTATNKTWSAKKISDENLSLLTQINSKADEPTGTKSAGKVYGLDSNLNPAWVDGGGSVDPSVIAEAVDDWLDEHPEAVTTVQDGAITKAKLNDEVSAYIKTTGYITGWDDPSITVENGYITSTGGNGSASSYQRTSYIPVSEGNTFAYKLYGGGGYCAYGYDSSKNPVNGSGVAGQEKYTEGTYTVPSGVAFVRFSTKKTSVGYFNSNQKIKEVYHPSNILDTIMAALTNKSATQSDVGKYPIIKTVENGAVSEWDLSTQTAYLVAGETETDLDIKATGSIGTGINSWGLTPKVEDICFVKEFELKMTAGNSATVFLAEYISASSYKVTDRICSIVAEHGEGYYTYRFAEPYRMKSGEFLVVTYSKNSVFYQSGSGLSKQYLLDSSNPVLSVGHTYTGTMSWGSYALCAKITFLNAVNGDISNDFYKVKREVSDESSKVDALEKNARGQQYISVFFDNFNEAKTDWVDSDEAWTFDYTNRTLTSTANGDVSNGSNCLILNRMYHADKRVASFRIKFASDTVLDIGFRSVLASNHDGEGKVRIDLANDQLIIYNGFTTSVATKDISSFTISTDNWYIVEVERRNLVASLRIRDFITGNEVSLDYEFPNGFFFDELYTLGKASGGDVVIKEFNVSMILNPLVYIIGDSITAYSSQIGGWSYLLNNDLDDNVVVSGRGNDTGASAPVKFETEARFIKPKYLIWCYGHNGEGITASRLASVQTLCDEIGCKFIVNHMTCMREDLHIGRNAVVEEEGYRGARFDVATARDGNPYPVSGDSNIRADSSLYMDTCIHPNLAGYKKMYERLKIDLPELFYQ